MLAPRPEDAPAGLGAIVVSRSTATLTYLDADNTPRFTTYVSLGRAGVDTPEGEYETMGNPTVAAGDIARWAIGTIPATPVLIVD